MVSKKLSSQITFSLTFILICLSVFFMIFGTIFVWKAYKDIDNAFNMLNLQYQGFLPEMVDVAPFTGKEYRVEEIYTMGMKEFLIGNFLYILSFVFTFSFTLAYLLEVREVRKKKAEEM